MMSPAHVTALVLLGTTLFAASDASAVVKSRRMAVNATGACQSALPVFDSNLRKRPKAVQNEGTSPAWVTCSYYSQGYADTDAGNPTEVIVYFATNDNQADTLTCTGVSGYNTSSLAPAFVIKSIDLPASGDQVWMAWQPGDFGVSGQLPSGLFSISCLLNPGVGINDSYIEYQEDVGA